MPIAPLWFRPTIRRTCASVGWSIAVAAITLPVAAASANWSITDLGANARPVDINDQGVVLMSKMTIDGKEYNASAINNAGQIVLTNASSQLPYLLDNGVLIALGDSDTRQGLYSAHALNDSGQVAGSGYATWQHQMAFWQNGATTLRDLGGQYSVAYGINEHGDLAGFADTEYSVVAVLATEEEAVPLGLAGTYSFARGLNDRGWVVGAAATRGRFSTHAFVTFGRGTSLSIFSIGTLGGQNSDAFGINNAGQIVGSSQTEFYVPSKSSAFLWEGGVMTDLSLLPEVRAGGWDSLRGANAINELGQIVGYGSRNNVMHGFLLSPIPIPEPETWATLLLGLAVLGLRRPGKRGLAAD